jgi:hypothetical protein
MRRVLTVIGLGVGGLALAISLSLGAFALAGRSLGQPATAVQISESPTKDHAGHDHASPSPGAKHHADGTPTSSPVEDHSGSSGGGGGGSSTTTSHGSHDHSSGGDD